MKLVIFLLLSLLFLSEIQSVQIQVHQQDDILGGLFGEIDKPKIKATVNLVWPLFDKKKIGALTKKQTKEIAKKLLGLLHLSLVWNDKLFDKIFDEVDSDHDGALEKHELVNLIYKIMHKGKK